jgi:hypothetical protein
MAGLNNHLKVVSCLRTIDNEVAQWGITTGARDDVDIPAVAAVVENAAFSLQQGPAMANLLGKSKIDSTKVYRYNAGAGAYSLIFELVAAIPATTTPALPMQCAAVLTIRTPEPVGTAAPQRFKNRAYLGPVANGAVDSDGRILLSFINDSLQVFQDLHNALALIPTTSPTDPAGLAVRTFAGLSIVDATSIEMGDVVDTQRRRRSQLVENRVARTIP